MASRVKWDLQADHKLLLKILEAHPNFSVDTTKVAELWAESSEEVHPTPRAIRERLGVIKKQAGLKTAIKVRGTQSKSSKPSLSSIRLIGLAVHSQTECQDSTMSADQSISPNKNQNGSQPATKKLDFLHSSFQTQHRNPEKKKSQHLSNSTNKRKRKRHDDDDTSDEEPMSTSESEVPSESTSPPTTKSRSSLRIKNSKPVQFEFRDIQWSSDEKNRDDSEDSDQEFSIEGEWSRKKAQREKHGRPRKLSKVGKHEDNVTARNDADEV